MLLYGYFMYTISIFSISIRCSAGIAVGVVAGLAALAGIIILGELLLYKKMFNKNKAGVDPRGPVPPF